MAFNGNEMQNPYNFQHFDLETISLKINGVTTPSSPHKMDFTNSKFIKPYKALFDSTGFAHTNSGNSLTPNNFANGNTFIAFDLTPDQCNGWHEHPKKLGVIDLHLSFKKALAETITVIIYSSFENRIFIDRYKNFATDYTV
jgi:hypothetical protein